MAFVVVVEKLRPNQGRNEDQTYINVLAKRGVVVGATLADWVTANPSHPWNQGGFNEFVIEITAQEYDDFSTDGANPLFHDGQQNLPRWQQQNTGTNTTKSFGSWADPTTTTTWQADTEIPDDREIFRCYDGPVLPQNHIATVQTSTGDPTDKTINLALFDENDVASTTSVDRIVDIGGQLLDLPFTNGESSFIVPRIVGKALFPSNGSYRIVGPSGEKEFTATIVSRELRVDG